MDVSKRDILLPTAYSVHENPEKVLFIMQHNHSQSRGEKKKKKPRAKEGSIEA